MANTPISGFTSGSPAQSTDEFVVARSGSNFKLTGSDLKTLSVGAGSVDVASGKTLTASNTLTLAGTDGTTMTFPSTSATLARTDAGNTFTGNQTVNGGTITANAPVLNLSQTWNNSGVTFTGLQFNATDTASAAGSLLLDLGTGGGSFLPRFSVRKDGYISTPQINIAGAGGIGIYSTVGSAAIVVGGGGRMDFCPNNSRAAALTSAGFNSTAFALGTDPASPDLFLTRRGAANLRLGAADAAAPVAQTLSVQSVVAGTTNTAGANLTITGSQGTGSGAGGSIIFQVAPANGGGGATVQNPLATALTIASNLSATFASDVRSTTAFPRYGGVSGIVLAAGATDLIAVIDNFMTLQSGAALGWSSGLATATQDTILRRDAANTLALRNSTNAQTFNIYNTFTSSTNFERFRIFAQSADTVLIGTEKGSGGGTARALALQTDATTRLTLTTLGSVVVNTAAVATTATDGFLYVPTCAGTPTGTPTTQTGTAPIVVDTTNNKLYFYSGGAWRDAGP